MSQEKWKKRAAREAAGLVDDGMKVGLGSGSTLAEVVKFLGDRGSKSEFVAASSATQQIADKMGLNLISLEKGSRLDITIDGADEVAPDFSMIKGGGGAHTREKIVASAAEEVAIVVDRSKLVERLGENGFLPVEVVPFAHEYLAGVLEGFGKGSVLRKSRTGNPFVTDNGNYIIDLEIESIEDPSSLGRRLNQVPGVIENGIFFDLADRVFVGYEGGCEVLESEGGFHEFEG